MKIFRHALAGAGALMLSACAVPVPAPHVAALAQVLAPARWQAPLPLELAKLIELSAWWQSQGDPLLVELIDAAQAVSPTLAVARSRIAQARAERVAASAALLPTLDAGASVNRMSQQSALPLGTTAQAGVQTAWELDLFGAGGAARDAAQARLQGAQAGWHDARIALAAEVANQYYGLRACEQLLRIAGEDAASRAASARLTELAAHAGLQAPANAALARAGAADAEGRTIAQRAGCDLDIKALVALSAWPEVAMRHQLAASPAVPLPAGAFTLSALPAQTLSQRPDVFGAEREVAAASAEVGSAGAQRYPRLSLSGSVGIANFRSAGVSTSLTTWNIGPLALSLPVFDGGRRNANLDAANARYDAAVVQYRASVRQAVREVEQALVNLDATNQRSGAAHTALEGYRRAFIATEDRYQYGLASLFELEDARRTRLASENTVVNLQRERSSAWVALYRAAGGGWTASAN